MASVELPLFVHWEKTLSDIFSRTEKFPKRVRFAFSSRIDNLALDILEKIVEARYAKDKSAALAHASLSLEKLRVLRLDGSGKRRLIGALRSGAQGLIGGRVSENDLAASLRSRLGHAEHADTLGLRRSLNELMNFGSGILRAPTG